MRIITHSPTISFVAHPRRPDEELERGLANRSGKARAARLLQLIAILDPVARHRAAGDQPQPGKRARSR